MSPQLRVKSKLAQVRRLNREIAKLYAELHELIRQYRPQLLAKQDCGPLVAAILIGHTAGVERFRSHASFALLSGAAPIPVLLREANPVLPQPRR